MDYIIKNILVPTDFSGAANNAIKLAVAMAERHEATIHLMHCVQPASFAVPAESATGYFGVETTLLELGRQSLEQIKIETAKYSQVPIELSCEIGILAELCNTYSKSHSVDIIVMGTYGASGIKELLIGSNTLAVIKETTIPVLTVPESFQKMTFDKILYPLRSVDGIVEKYDYIRPIAAKNDSDIFLLGVEEEEQFNDGVKKIAQYMDQVRSLVLQDHLHIHGEIVSADSVSDKILEKVVHNAVDLLIINATLDYKWYHFFDGSYTQQILSKANVPVLSIKPQLTEG